MNARMTASTMPVPMITGYQNPIPARLANCYHCGWGGRLPPESDTKNWMGTVETAMNGICVERWRVG